jgi:hypothetical protein
MPHGAKTPPAGTSRRNSPSAPSPKDVVSPRPDQDAVEACLDNDLGAEGPGNSDCVEKAVTRSRRKLQGR